MKVRSPVLVNLAGFLFVIAIVVAVAQFDRLQEGTEGKVVPAPDFRAEDVDGELFNLSDLAGGVILLHFTSIENPICMECERELQYQTVELANLSGQYPNLTIITINMRMNQRSEDGKTLAYDWWGVNVTLYWVEEFDPFPISGTYIDYWNLKGGTANPAILLIDPDQDIVAVYHVYQMGKGRVDGIQRSHDLLENVVKIEAGEWEGFQGRVSGRDHSFMGMFLLGIITSFSPCSLALLVTMFSYIMATSGVGDASGGTPGGTSGRAPGGTSGRAPGSTSGRAPGSTSGGTLGSGDRSHSEDGLIIGISFTMGMGLVFFILGLFVSSIGSFLRYSSLFYLISGGVLVILGVNNLIPIRDLVHPIRERFLGTGPGQGRDRGGAASAGRTLQERFTVLSVSLFKRSRFLGAFFLGMFFSLGWAPCALSLILPVIVWMISADISLMTGALLMFVFGLGHGVPIIPLSIASSSGRGKIADRYIRAGKVITRVFGMAIILFGIAFMGRYFGYYLW